MPIPTVCPSCSAKLRAPDNVAGSKMKCPKCGTAFTVPGPVVAGGTPPLPTAPPDLVVENAAEDEGTRHEELVEAVHRLTEEVIKLRRKQPTTSTVGFGVVLGLWLYSITMIPFWFLFMMISHTR